MDLWIVLVIILVAVLVWRGPKTLPQLGKAFGRGVREAREEAAKAQSEIQARTTTDPDTADTVPDNTDAPPATSDAAPATTDGPPPRADGTPPSAA